MYNAPSVSVEWDQPGVRVEGMSERAGWRHVWPGAGGATSVLLALSAIGLGHALQLSNGFYRPRALAWLSLSLAFCVAALAFARRADAEGEQGPSRLTVVVLLGGLAWQLAELAIGADPIMYPRQGADLTAFRAGVALEAVAIAAGAARVRGLRHAWFPLVLAASLGLGVWAIRNSPSPPIDVVVVHREAIDALARHDNPYTITFPDIYGPRQRPLYNASAVSGGRVSAGYMYPPPNLLLVAPAQWLFGDYRYAELALLLAAAGMIGWSRRDQGAKLAACLLLTTPRVFFVIEQGWTEPVGLFVLAAAMLLIAKAPARAGWALGLLLVTKQYLALCTPPVLRAAFRDRRLSTRILASAALTGAVVVLPFVAWHPRAFLDNVVWLQTREPFRMDSLSYLSWAARHGLGQGSFWWAIAAAAAGSALGLGLTRSTPAGCAATIAVTTFALFAFGSKAFCNYYFFVIGSLCCAVAAHSGPASSDQSIPGMPGGRTTADAGSGAQPPGRL
jgi:hypothetical protein